jgi:hypothetical protein
MPEYILSEDLIADIGESIGLKMWSKRDKTIEYDYPGARGDEPGDANEYYNGNIVISNRLYLLVFSKEGLRFYQIKGKSDYTLNLHTIKPTANSPIKTIISEELKERIRNECIINKAYKNIPPLIHK